MQKKDTTNKFEVGEPSHSIFTFEQLRRKYKYAVLKVPHDLQLEGILNNTIVKIRMNYYYCSKKQRIKIFGMIAETTKI